MRRVAGVIALCGLMLVGVACGNGGGGSGLAAGTKAADTRVARTAAARGTVVPAATPRPGTQAAGTAPAGATAGAAGQASGTASVAGVSGATTPAPADATSSAPASADATSSAAPAADASIAAPGSADGLSDFEATVASGASADIAGGAPSDPPRVVVPVPAVTPAPGTTPVVDPTQFAAPVADGSDLALVVDADAASDGDQSSRTVRAGDVFKVAVVIQNVPPSANNIGGVSAFNFELDYDKTRIVAPTVQGGPSTQRNPDLNVPALGGVDAGWTCLPAPEGDLDDPGGINGDGDPATGQAFLSCFTPGKGQASGTLVLAIVTFTAIAPGSTTLSLRNVDVSDPLGITLGSCTGDPGDGPFIPCRQATVNVQ